MDAGPMDDYYEDPATTYGNPSMGPPNNFGHQGPQNNQVEINQWPPPGGRQGKKGKKKNQGPQQVGPQNNFGNQGPPRMGQGPWGNNREPDEMDEAMRFLDEKESEKHKASNINLPAGPKTPPPGLNIGLMHLFAFLVKRIIDLLGGHIIQWSLVGEDFAQALFIENTFIVVVGQYRLLSF